MSCGPRVELEFPRKFGIKFRQLLHRRQYHIVMSEEQSQEEIAVE